MRFKDGKAASIQKLDSLRVKVDACHVVPDRGKAATGYEAKMAAAYDMSRPTRRRFPRRAIASARAITEREPAPRAPLSSSRPSRELTNQRRIRAFLDPCTSSDTGSVVWPKSGFWLAAGGETKKEICLRKHGKKMHKGEARRTERS